MDNTNFAPVAKQKSGTGLKIAVIVLAILAVAGCGAAIYLFINKDSKTNNSAVAKDEKDKEKTECASVVSPETGKVEDSKAGTRYIYLDGYDYALKVPDNLIYLSYEYRQFNMGDSNSSTFDGNYSVLTINAAVNGVDHQSAPEFIEDGMEEEYVPLGSITIGRVNPKYKDDNLLSQPVLTGLGADGGRNVYFDGPQSVFSKEKWSADWEQKSAAEIQKWLTNKSNYIKLK